MPKVKPLGKAETRREILRSVIQGNIGRQGRTTAEVSEFLGISLPTYNKKLKDASFDFRELSDLIKYLHIPKEDVLLLFDMKDTPEGITSEIRKTNEILAQLVANAVVQEGQSKWKVL